MYTLRTKLNRIYKREQRKKRGLCVECGKPLDDITKAACSRCRSIAAARTKRYRQNKKAS